MLLSVGCSSFVDLSRANVRFVDPLSPGTESWRTAKPKRHACLCEALHKHNRAQSAWWSLRLELGTRCEGVKGHNPQKRSYKAAALSHQRTLESLLSSTSKDWTSFAKLTLAVMMSHSLCYLYGSVWASERWSRLNIVFFSDGEHTPLRPFLSSDPMKARGPLTDPDGQHQYPELLELGIILLEIHLGRSIEDFRGYRQKILNYDELWLESQRAFDERRLHIESLVYREAIRKCLAPNFSMSNTCDALTLKKAIYQEVVKPLQEELVKNFRDEFASLQYLDDTAEQKIDLASGFVDPTLPSTVTGPLQVVASASVSHRQSTPLPPSASLAMHQTHHACVSRPLSLFELFGEEDQEQPVGPLARQYVVSFRSVFIY